MLEPGVFRTLPTGTITWQQRLAALALSVGGVAYGRSATALHGLSKAPPVPEVLVVRGHRNRLRPGVHSTRALPNSDIALVNGIRATMPARSLCDAATTLTLTDVCNLVDAAVVRRLVRPAGLARRASELRNSKRPGCTKVLSALALQHPQLDRARNEWEALALRLVRARGLPEPVPNYVVVVDGQRRVLDLAWPPARAFLEFDGFRVHMVRRVFDDDRVRQNALVADGWVVFRTTSNMLTRNPDSVFGPLEHILRLRGHDTRKILLAS
jgi:very-short-patch-repair endonuclease